MSKLVMLSKPYGCGGCIGSKRHIEKRGIPVTILDAGTEENIALAASRGHRQAPIFLEYAEDGTIIDSWSGFDPDRLDTFIPAVPEAVAA